MLKALDLIIRYETGGLDYYLQEGINPHWPGGDSGVTIGCGSDLGQIDLEGFQQAWQKYLPEFAMKKLEKVVGLKGEAAKAEIKHLTDIEVPWDVMKNQFIEVQVPLWHRKVLTNFPNAQLLLSECRGVLLSLAYNRGLSFDGSRRVEMAAIRNLVWLKRPQEVPVQIRRMKRLWPAPETEYNLRGRREAEAKLWEQTLLAAKQWR